MAELRAKDQQIVDTMQTIRLLLWSNPANQREFSSLKGYSLLLRLIALLALWAAFYSSFPRATVPRSPLGSPRPFRILQQWQLSISLAHLVKLLDVLHWRRLLKDTKLIAYRHMN